MKQIKILTVGGESYQITDPEAARIHDGAVDETHIWSGKGIVDRLCPAFTETGELVACNPVEGYPLTIAVEEGANAITRYGKNLFDKSAEIAQCTYGGVTRWGYLIELPAGTYTTHLEHIGEASSNYVYGYHYDANGNSKGSAQLSNATKLNAWTFTIAEGDKVYIIHGKDQSQSAAVNVFAKYNTQIEAGSVATAFEPYFVETYAPTDTILAKAGVNTFKADHGNITVTGRADPVAENAKLMDRLAALEAALINT